MSNKLTQGYSLSWSASFITKIFVGLLLIVLAILSSGCTSYGSIERIKLREIKMASLAEMPDYVQTSAPEIQEAYRFAAANPEILRHISCFCGCNSLGHTSNLECYVNEAGFDNHAAFCLVCVDITQDTMELTRTGKPLEQIRTFIIDKYSKYGPSTDTVASSNEGMADPMGTTWKWKIRAIMFQLVTSQVKLVYLKEMNGDQEIPTQKSI